MNPLAAKATQAASGMLRRPAGGGGSPVVRAIFGRILFVLPFAASVGLLWWTLYRITPVTRQSQNLTQRTTTLSQQVEQMQLRQNQAEKDQLVSRYQGTLSQYLDGQEALTEWMNELRSRAVTLALEVNPKFGDIITREVADQSLSILPVELEIVPAQGIESDRTTYQRIIELLLYVSSHPKRADVVQLNVSGHDGAASGAVLNLNLWGIQPKS